MTPERDREILQGPQCSASAAVTGMKRTRFARRNNHPPHPKARCAKLQNMQELATRETSFPLDCKHQLKKTPQDDWDTCPMIRRVLILQLANRYHVTPRGPPLPLLVPPALPFPGLRLCASLSAQRLLWNMQCSQNATPEAPKHGSGLWSLGGNEADFLRMLNHD